MAAAVVDPDRGALEQLIWPDLVHPGMTTMRCLAASQVTEFPTPSGVHSAVVMNVVEEFGEIGNAPEGLKKTCPPAALGLRLGLVEEVGAEFCHFLDALPEARRH